MDREDLVRRVRATFVGELQEHVRTMTRDLLAVEEAPPEGTGEHLDSLYRTVHSLKGAARAADVPAIEAACHRLEEILGTRREHEAPVDPDLSRLLFRLVDALEEAVGPLSQGTDPDPAPLRALLPALEGLGGRQTPVSRLSKRRRPVATPAVPGEAAVRVSVERLDTLVRSSGELLVARRRVRSRYDELVSLLEATRTQAAAMAPGAIAVREEGGATRTGLGQLELGLERLLEMSRADHRLLDQAAGRLEEEVLRLRMAPFSQLCEGLPRMVRDLAVSTGREVDLVVEDAAVELDRAVLAQLRDPLVHLVRNAVAHGVEPPADREAAGKPRRGRVVVGAAVRGGSVEITVSDDGQGIPVDAVRARARRSGLPLTDDERELARMVFLPGFSTATTVSEIAGRGVGLEVVSHRVHALHGSVDLDFERGRGASFSLTVPLTLSTLRALLLRCGESTFAVPTTNVARLLRLGSDDVVSVAGYETFAGHDPPLRVVALADVLRSGSPPSPRPRVPVVVAAAGDRQIALVVDELLGEHDVVVKSLGPRFKRVRNVAGATILPDGGLALILSAADLVQAASSATPPRPAVATPAGRPRSGPARVLVVDDSRTTRALERAILEGAGYDVLVAAAGDEAWSLLQDEHPDVVVTDVEMPGMDGFALTAAIRGSERLRDVAVVVVTARGSERDRLRGLESGADAYLPKGTLDQASLLETIERLL